MNPRSCLRWKPTGRIFKTIGLRWVPTGKIFAFSTNKVDSEPPNGSKEDITNQCESEQALDVSAGTLLSTADQASVFMAMTSVHISSGLVLHQMTSDHNRSELGIQDHSNEQSSSKLVPKVVSSMTHLGEIVSSNLYLRHKGSSFPCLQLDLTSWEIDSLKLLRRPRSSEPSEFRVPQETQPLSSKDKVKGIMIEPEVPLKRKYQIALDEQIIRDIQAKLDAELLEEQKLARKQEEEANILVKSLEAHPWLASLPLALNLIFQGN
ncbi:hypothetical protein Tco_0370435 [Tanacetum coccineum]